MTVTEYVDSPFKVQGITRDIKVAVFPDFQKNCYSGINFLRIFKAQFDASSNKLILDKNIISLQVAATDIISKVIRQG